MADDRSSDGLLAFLLGAVAGAAAGVLLAPRSGEETREILRDWLEETREKTRDFVEKEREHLRHKKEQIEGALDAAKKAYRDADRA
ncbi:MAG: YtxH domain-containing protein [Elusimicrobia bacterium]|nr:YtxH domain-containing protein [Elusimicrobiota bacterium]